MPGKEQLLNLRRMLAQLNRLEEEKVMVLRAGRSTLDADALIESLRANLPVSLLVQHDGLHARGRRSTSEVRNGVCSGCHMTLPWGTQSEVRKQSAVVRCDYCGRFLFLADDESAQIHAKK